MAVYKPYRKLFERGVAEHPLTPHKLRLLQFVAECGILTVPQLSGLSGLTEKAVRGHMRDLFDLELVDRVGVPRAAVASQASFNSPDLLWGRAPTIYSLSRLGVKNLVQSRIVAKSDLPDIATYGPMNHLFLAHELEVRCVRVWLEQVKRRFSHLGVLEWKNGSRAQVGNTRPDARFIYQVGEAVIVGFVEIDRGTEKSPARWQEKFSTYVPLLTGNAVHHLTGHRQGRVIVITPTERRRDTVAGLLSDCLSGSGINNDRFWVAARSVLDDPDPSAFLWRVPERPDLMPLIPARLL